MNLPVFASIVASTIAGAATASPAPSLFAPGPVSSCLRPAAALPALAACFAEGTDPEYMEAVMAWVTMNSNPGGGPDFNIGGRWSNTSSGPTGVAGDPITLSYSFPSDNLGNIGGGLTTQNELNARMVQWFGSVAAGRALVASVFDRWSQLAGLRYTQVGDDDAPWGASGVSGTRGDVRIVSINIDNPGNVLAFNFFPDTGDMVIDATDGFASGSNNFRFFRNTVSHEHGHGHGLSHVCPQNGSKLMEPGLNTGFEGPQHDDIRGANFNYGDLLENNDSAAAAATPPFNGTLNISTLSIDRFGDEDWVRLNLPGAGPLTVSISPIGFTYDSSTQGATCGSGNFINSNTADLVLELYSNNGATLLLSRNQNGVGQGESFTSFAIPSSGAYFLRVFASSHPTGGVQLYSMNIAHIASACPGDANGDNMVNFADLNLVLFQFGVVGPNTPGDVNHDGVVNFLDLNIVLANFGQSC